MADEAATRSASILSFDVGGSHITAGWCEPASLRLMRMTRARLRGDEPASRIMDLVYELGRDTASGALDKAGAAVLAFPGPFDYCAGISQMRHKLQSLYGVDLREGLAQRFHWPAGRFLFLNDAGAFLLGEVAAGAAQGAARAVGIALGTGIGSAFARNGRWVKDGEGVPPGGEIWNLPYGEGIVEDLLSTRAIREDYARRTGKDKDVAAIAADAAADADARQVFESFGVNLGQVLRAILAPFGPDVIVVGGGIARSAGLFLPIAQRQLEGMKVRLVTASLGDEAPLVGATAFWHSSQADQEIIIA